MLRVLLINDVAESGFSRQSLEYAVAIYSEADFMDIFSSTCAEGMGTLHVLIPC